MKKAELIIRLAELDDIESKAAATRIYDTLVDTIVAELKAGNSVELGQKLGTFKIAQQAAKTGTVPGTDKTYSTPAKNVVKFRPSAGLKREVA